MGGGGKGRRCSITVQHFKVNLFPDERQIPSEQRVSFSEDRINEIFQ